MLFKKLIRTAWSYKAQFISMIIMIGIGVGIFLGFNIEWHSIESDTAEFFEITDYADFRIYSEGGFTASEAEKAGNIQGVDGATRFLSVNVGIKGKKRTLTLNVSKNYSVSTMLITDGAEYSSDADGIWLSDLFAEENGFSLGDTLILVYKGAEISGEVIGLCKSSENMICVADSNQLMPDYKAHGFAYITTEKLENSFGAAFYPQINIKSDLEKAELENSVKATLGKTLQIADKELHNAYAGAKSEAEEGKIMGSVLPVLFLCIAVLTMVTTMHRIAASEKVQIGTLKALGFRNARILFHYTSYGLVIGLLGLAVGIALGYAIAVLIMSPNGMMATYFDLPFWRLSMPMSCVPVLIFTVLFLTLISFFLNKAHAEGHCRGCFKTVCA